jgi:hypothetical protein
MKGMMIEVDVENERILKEYIPDEEVQLPKELVSVIRSFVQEKSQ